jgi:hypothetical protein
MQPENKSAAIGRALLADQMPSARHLDWVLAQ